MASDGSLTGSSLCADIFPGTGYSNAGMYSGLFTFNNKLFFSADDSLHGSELWVSDGTAAGTHIFADLEPGITSSGPNNFIVLGNRMFFVAELPQEKVQLLSTDGINIRQQSNLSTNLSGGFNPTLNIVRNNHLYMCGYDSATGAQLYQIGINDATPTLINVPGSSAANALKPLGTFGTVNNILVFSARYDSTGFELWFYRPSISDIEAPFSELNVSAYPNPFKDQITLTGLQPQVSYVITLLDITGRVLNRLAGATINTKELAGGMYLLQISDGINATTLKLIKE